MTTLVQARDAGTCWSLDTAAGALAANASALAAAFPPIRLRFRGGASFGADPRGYLTSPRQGDAEFVCLSFFQWCVHVQQQCWRCAGCCWSWGLLCGHASALLACPQCPTGALAHCLVTPPPPPRLPQARERAA